MNNKLIIAILSMVKEGNTFGHQGILEYLKKSIEFMDLTPEEYAATMKYLMDNGCIKRHPDPVNRTGYILGQTDCVPIYAERITTENAKTDKDDLIKELTITNLRLNNELLPLQKKELKGKIKWAILGAIGGAILSNGKDILAGIQRLCH